MVGVPGRSKACNTCRQRKVACSLEKPYCATCARASRVCAGYHRERIFILGPQTTYQAPKSSKLKEHIEGRGAISARKNNNGPLPEKTRSDDSDESRSVVRLVPIAKIDAVSPNSAYRQQLLAEFITSSLPGAYGGSGRGEIGRSWLSMLPSLSESSKALEASVLAVATAKLGRVSGNEVLLRESLKFYVNGIWELQQALWNPKSMYKVDTLAACFAMVMYEVVECPNKSLTALDAHMKGCARLAELRGPDTYISDFSHEIFLAFRIIEIQQAFAERRHTFLSRLDWIEHPFKDRSKSTFQLLLDLAAKGSEIIADGFQMLKGPIEGTEVVDPTTMLLTILGLIDRCWKVDLQLQNLYQSMEEEALGPLYWPELSTDFQRINEEELGNIFPVAFKFLDMWTAHTCMFFWATTIILWSGMTYTYKLLSGIQISYSTNVKEPPDKAPPQFNITQLRPLGHRVDLATPARNICQSIEFCLAEEFAGVGARAATFPLKVAIEALNDIPGCEQELEWAQAAVTRLSQSGVRALQHLPVAMTDHVYIPV